VPERWRDRLRDAPAFVHVLTHKDLHLHPMLLDLPSQQVLSDDGAWFDAAQWPQLGLPAPIRKLLAED